MLATIDANETQVELAELEYYPGLFHFCPSFLLSRLTLTLS
jgi:hypothetical protein